MPEPAIMSNLTMGEMVFFYNALTGENVPTFRHRGQATDRLEKALKRAGRTLVTDEIGWPLLDPPVEGAPEFVPAGADKSLVGTRPMRGPSFIRVPVGRGKEPPRSAPAVSAASAVAEVPRAAPVKRAPRASTPGGGPTIRQLTDEFNGHVEEANRLGIKWARHHNSLFESLVKADKQLVKLRADINEARRRAGLSFQG